MSPATDTSEAESSLLRSFAGTDSLDALDRDREKDYAQSRPREYIWSSLPTWFRFQSPWARPRVLLALLGAFLTLSLLGTFWHLHSNSVQRTAPIFVKPEGFKIIGLIFFGRPDRVAILDCYLKKNLVENGGFLDEVHWVANTNNEQDLHYLDQLVPTSPSYSRVDLPELGFEKVWEHAIERGNLYIKIDDDVVSGLSLIFI